jgi:actin-related protein 5
VWNSYCAQECALDYTFINLGIESGRIEQPIVMTERLANPLFTRASELSRVAITNNKQHADRKVTSELLFELYGAPEVAYGIDSLFAFSRHQHRDGLSVHLGHNATTIIPVVDGRGVLTRAKRYVQSVCCRCALLTDEEYHGAERSRQT